MALSMTFNKLTPELRERGKRFFRDIEQKKVSGKIAAELFFKYFFKRLKIMFKDEPEKLDIISQYSLGKTCMFAVRHLFQVTAHLKSFDEIPVTDQFDRTAPQLTFDNIWTVFDIITSDLTFIDAVLKKKVKIDKMAALAKIFSPIEALHPKDQLLVIYDQDMQLLASILSELGY
ncbi:MAG: hypothetical protein ACTSRC_16870 [Candidatus Helarchaeota archaeon]